MLTLHTALLFHISNHHQEAQTLPQQQAAAACWQATAVFCLVPLLQAQASATSRGTTQINAVACQQAAASYTCFKQGSTYLQRLLACHSL